MYKHILLPVDGSKISEQAAAAGIELARALGARVTALHVLPETPFPGLDAWAHPEPHFAEKLLATLEKRGRLYVEEVCEAAHRAGVACECAVSRGASPHAEIVFEARERHCDLIVMASHGMRDSDGLLLGSETSKTATLSDVPVLVHRVKRSEKSAP